MKIPQADDVVKIMDIPLAIANGSATTHSAATRYTFDRRQAQYYFDAAEMLGLINRGRYRYLLSGLGRKYMALGYSERKLLFTRRMLSLEVTATLISELIANPQHRLTRREVEKIIMSREKLSNATIKRRARTLFSWFKWLGQQTRAFRADSNKIALNVRK